EADVHAIGAREELPVDPLRVIALAVAPVLHKLGGRPPDRGGVRPRYGAPGAAARGPGDPAARVQNGAVGGGQHGYNGSELVGGSTCSSRASIACSGVIPSASAAKLTSTRWRSTG